MGRANTNAQTETKKSTEIKSKVASQSHSWLDFPLKMTTTEAIDVMDVEDAGNDDFQEQFDSLDLSQKDSSQKLKDFLALLRNPRSDEHAIKVKEQCVYRLAKIFTENKQFAEVANILKDNNDFFGVIPKARTAKIVRNMLNIVATVPDSLSIQVDLCKDVVAWCKVEKRTFLRQRIEAKVTLAY